MAGSSVSMNMKRQNENEMQLSSSKRRILETLEKLKDRISALPDAILLHILSLCSTEEAIRTGALSKRWQYVWTSVPILVFDFDECRTKGRGFISSVNGTLVLCRHNKLDMFKISCYSYTARYQSHFNRWIRYAVGCNVEDLVISLDSLEFDVFTLPEHIYRSSCFKKLRLESCNWEPVGEINWKNLKLLHIGYECITQKLINNILAGSRSLEILVLFYCYGFDELDITSTSLRKLVVSGYYDTGCKDDRVDVVRIQAHNILSLTIKEHLSISKVMLVDVPSLVEAKLDYEREFNDILIVDEDPEAEEEMLKTFIRSLQHVKSLKVGQSCLEVLSRLEAKGFTYSPNMKLPITS